MTVGESSPLLLGPVLKKDDEKEQEKDDVPGATRLRDPGVDDGGLRRLRRANNTRFRVKNRSGNLGRSNPGVGKGRCALDVESVDGTNETLGRNSRGVDRIGGAHGGRGDVGGIRTRGFRDEKGEAIAVAAKLAAVIRKQDKIAALNILRAVQVLRSITGYGSRGHGDIGELYTCAFPCFDGFHRRALLANLHRLACDLLSLAPNTLIVVHFNWGTRHVRISVLQEHWFAPCPPPPPKRVISAG